MAETCVFCGAEADSFPPEHWIPQWVSRAVVGPNQIVEHHAPDGSVWHDTVFGLEARSRLLGLQ